MTGLQQGVLEVPRSEGIGLSKNVTPQQGQANGGGFGGVGEPVS